MTFAAECWRCHTVATAGTDVHGDSYVPAVGDACLCIECGALCIVGPAGLCRPSTEQESELMALPELAAAVMRVQQFLGAEQRRN